MFIEILFKMLLFKGGVLIYAEHCTCNSNTDDENMNVLQLINESCKCL